MATKFGEGMVARVKSILMDELEAHFSATLLQEPDIVNILAGMVHLESRFDYNRVGPPVSYRPGTQGFVYFNSSVMKALDKRGIPLEVANSFQGIQAVGLMQVMGWNFVRGASYSGKCEIERLRPDLAVDLTVAPGEDIFAWILGEGNMDKAIRAGLIVLEGKFKLVSYSTEGYKVRGDPFNRKFPTKIGGAVAAYLGLGRADSNGTTPEAYSASVVGGADYVAANSNSLKVKISTVNVASSRGPTTNSTGQRLVVVPGCA